MERKVKIKITKWEFGDPLSHGTVTLGNGKTYTFRMTHFDGPVDYAIDGGRIIKLEIRDAKTGEIAIRIDRSREILPRTSDQRAVFDALTAKYN